MKTREQELLALFDKYGADRKKALRENKRLDYLYALAKPRENLLEWYAFKAGSRILQVGAGDGALTGLLAERAAAVDVLDPSKEQLEVVRRRFAREPELSAKIRCIRGQLVSDTADAVKMAAGDVREPVCEGTEVRDAADEDVRLETAGAVRMDVERLLTAASYDYVVLIGALSEKQGKEAQFAAAKALLAPDGVLIAAACNYFGMKYFAGARRDAVTVSRRELEGLLPGARFYYPMPDYRLPSEIYSDDYLPKKGDLTGALAVYDYPRYLLMDVGAAYDAACEDGRFGEFANSFLVFWEKGGGRTAAGQASAGESAAGEKTSTQAAAGESATGEKASTQAAAGETATGETASTQAAEAAVASRTEVSEGAVSGSAGSSADVLYVKYNRTRQERFQIKTVIRRNGDGLLVEKTALSPEGADHIRSFAEKYEALDCQNDRVRLARPELADDGMTARFPYLQGETLAELLGKRLAGGGTEAVSGQELSETQAKRDKDAPSGADWAPWAPAIRQAVELIWAARPGQTAPFSLTPEFMAVFDSLGELSQMDAGEQEALLKDESFSASNVDALFENMLVTAEGVSAIDYEWVFFFPIPAGFLRWRTLRYFYSRYRSLLDGRTEREFLALFPELVSGREEVLALYEKMERGFQEYVHGENQRTYQEDYMVETKTLSQLAAVDGELERTRERLEQVRMESREKDTALKKVQEVQRLTNNHVANLEVMIGDLRREIGEMAKTIDYLNRHEALVFKVRRKLGQAFNRRFPKGTVTRKRMGYWKNAVLHPLRSLRMFTSEEGKNRIRGDFEIGEEYLQYGKLHFPQTEDPLVSIVIPVYNQIHYTYLCLQSILAHTADVSYEVIIADDVSTDATEHLTEFAKNLVICRNETNQGFLRNCNQAARAARGKYVMFLNNDTQVTEGWLSSLVRLIESDDSIGMVGSKLVYPDGRLQEAGGIIWSDGSGWNYGRLDDPDKAEYNYVKDVDYISGAAILLSRRLWNEIGGFDERFAPAYCEDSDLAFAVRKAGYRVVYQPQSKVIHFEGISNGTDVNGSGLKRYQVENSEKLREKWKDEFKKQCENTGNPNPFRARERSMGKKIIVVIDHYVPTFDRDAGSKTTFQYLKMFLKKGYVVKFVGDNYLHEEPYTSTLQQMGIEVLYGQEYLTGIWDWLEKNGREIHVAYLNRPHIATKYVDFIREHTDIRVIYYGHDLHFLREFREYELTGDVKKRRESEYWKSIEFSLMHKAAVSYYPSQVEADAIREADETIPVKAITAYVYENFLERINRDFEKREGLLFVGGFAHPPNADAVLWFAREVFPRIREKCPVNFYVVGSRVTEEIQALHSPDEGIIVKGFVSEEELAALYQNCRLVVVPLRYGAGVKGKVVEAIYNGAPIVTTSVGSEGIPEVEEVLEIADKPEDFAGAVVRLYRDADALRRMSEQTQAYIRGHFSIDAAWEVIREDFA